jgi:hypothetical protein
MPNLRERTHEDASYGVRIVGHRSFGTPTQSGKLGNPKLVPSTLTIFLAWLVRAHAGHDSVMGFNRHRIEHQRGQAAEKEAAARRATDAQVLTALDVSKGSFAT